MAGLRVATNLSRRGIGNLVRRRRFVCNVCPSIHRSLTTTNKNDVILTPPPVLRPNEETQQQPTSQPLCLGYVAGLQSASMPQLSKCNDDDENDVPWSSFDEAYEILQQVDPEVLLEFEQSLWEQDRMKFVHATKEISVIDLYPTDNNERRLSSEQSTCDDEHTATKAIRSMVFNARPKLIQSATEVEYASDGTANALWGNPPPLVGLTATHLGGLALAVPLWLAGKGYHRCSMRCDDNENASKPKAVVIGAGGCTIPSLLSKAGCNVTAVEPRGDVRHIAMEYFGAAKAGISLQSGLGEDYLKKNCRERNIDILIIDAEDGESAPPQSMKEKEFWKDVVSPSLAPDSVVAVNVISDPNSERSKFKAVVAEALSETHEIWCCEVPRVADVSNRHCIMFATPSSEKSGEAISEINEEGGTMKQAKNIIMEEEGFRYVDMPEEWLDEMEDAWTFRFYRSYIQS